MVAVTDIRRLNDLYREQRQIAAALKAFGSHAVITSMTIGGRPTPPGAEPDPNAYYGPDVLVATDSIAYPPQMVNAIQDQLVARQDAIRAALEQLGVTDLPQPAKKAG